jgi:hypothetical protein
MTGALIFNWKSIGGTIQKQIGLLSKTFTFLTFWDPNKFSAFCALIYLKLYKIKKWYKVLLHNYSGWFLPVMFSFLFVELRPAHSLISLFFAPHPRDCNLFILDFSLCRVAGRKHKWQKSATLHNIHYLIVIFQNFSSQLNMWLIKSSIV